MRLYLAGPVTGYVNWNQDKFHEAAEFLRQQGHTVWVPVDEIPTEYSWHEAMRACIRNLLLQEGLALLDGWESSKGARLEVTIADHLGMPIYAWRDWRHAAHNL